MEMASFLVSALAALYVSSAASGHFTFFISLVVKNAFLILTLVLCSYSF